MATDLILPAATQNEIGPLSAVANRASEFAQHAKAENTVRAYRADWADFQRWCTTHGQSSLPASPDILALYVTRLSETHKAATITRRLSAIAQGYQIAGFESPTTSAKVRLVMAGIRRTKGIAAKPRPRCWWTI